MKKCEMPDIAALPEDGWSLWHEVCRQVKAGDTEAALRAAVRLVAELAEEWERADYDAREARKEATDLQEEVEDLRRDLAEAEAECRLLGERCRKLEDELLKSEDGRAEPERRLRLPEEDV